MTTPTAEQLFYQALAKQQENALADAAALYREALQQAPGRASILSNLAVVLVGLRQYEEAEQLSARLLQADPHAEESLLILGACQSNLARKHDALATFERALKVNPLSVDALNGHGNVLVDLKRPDEALEDYENALRIAPNHAITLKNRANALMSMKQTRLALESYTQARLHSASEISQWDESICRLSLGDFAAGWKQYESRWEDGARGAILASAKPWWDGTPLNGALLVWGEQGIGDQILFAGMIPELARRVSSILLAVDPRLVAIFQRAFPAIHVIARDESLPGRHFDAHVALGSIGQHLRTQWRDFPADQAAYLRPDRDRSLALRHRMARGKLICGISWFSQNNEVAAEKSLRLMDLLPILALENVQSVDLQYGDTAGERQRLGEACALRMTHMDDIDNFNDIDGLAALIAACDAVITISNTTAHLAGALGKPTFLLLPYSTGRHWYWHEDRDDSPWYPSIKIFRQSAPGNWDDVIARIKKALL